MQEATPVASPGATASHPELLFVQTFGSGSLTPVDGTPDRFVLTADHLAGQTLYFSDRPARVVGMMPTEKFFGPSETGGLGFTPADPPNAALVVAGAGDATQIVLLELTDPRFDAATGHVSYSVQVLEELEALDLSLEQEPLSAADAAMEFTAASLFIDDMPDPNPDLGSFGVSCMLSDDTTIVWNGFIDYCLDTNADCIHPCTSADLSYWTDFCNQQDPGRCNGGCLVVFLYPEPGLCSDLYYPS